MNEQIRNTVRELRKNAKLTQEELARAMKVSRQTINSIEQGRYVPSLPLALRMARFFKRPTGDIFALEED
jgi:putative transcriptional regulator